MRGWKRLADQRTKRGRVQTEKQEAAVTRNFRVFRLRGLYAYALMLSPSRADAMRRLVDDELISLGAEPECERRPRLIREQMLRLEAEQKAGEDGRLQDL